MKLAQVQQALNAPKSQFNSFGKYSYRNCEDILKAVKPLLGEAVILLNDDIIQVGDKLFVKSTATYKSGDEEISVNALAEISAHKGMSAAQTTGAASSYARKYALNGLLLIDDNKDVDTKPTHITMEVLTQEIKDRQVDVEKLSAFLGISCLAELNKNKYAEALEAIKRKPKAENVLEL